MAKRERWSPTEDQLKQIRKMSGLGLGLERIAILMDVSKSTLERSAKKVPALRDAIEKGREGSGALLRDWAYDSARKGNVAMQIFLLKTREGLRETERVELTGADGAPLVPKKKLSYDEAVAVMEKYERIRNRVSKKT